MIDEAQIEHLALLARLTLSEAERSAYRDDLGRILDYVAELQKIGTEGVEPVHQVLGLKNVLRIDGAPTPSSTNSRLVKAAPAEKNGCVVVPRVLYHD